MKLAQLRSWARALSWEWDVRLYGCRYEHDGKAAAVAAGGPCLIALLGPEALRLPVCEVDARWPEAYPQLLFGAPPPDARRVSVADLLSWIGWLGGRDLPGSVMGIVVDRRLLRDVLSTLQADVSEIRFWPVSLDSTHVLSLEISADARAVLAPMPAAEIPDGYRVPSWPGP